VAHEAWQRVQVLSPARTQRRSWRERHIADVSDGAHTVRNGTEL
jgi:hypothetical protein